MHRLVDRSRMSGDVHVRFCEGLRGRFPRATQLLIFTDQNDSFYIEKEVESLLSEYDLDLNDSKTECKLIDQNFEYLGYAISKEKTSIKEANIERFITSIAAKFSSYLHNTDQRRKKYPWLNKETQKTVFLEDLNEKITGAIDENRRYGWIFYFLEISDMSLLHKLDNIIESFFKRLNDFKNKSPENLKKLSKAFYKAKYDPFGGYIHNYSEYDTIKQKLKYLGNRGHINPKGKYKIEDIEAIFARVKRRHLNDLDLDVGITS